MGTERLYATKKPDYFALLRQEIIELIPTGPNRVLEVGCGAGVTLRELKRWGKAPGTVVRYLVRARRP